MMSQAACLPPDRRLLDGAAISLTYRESGPSPSCSAPLSHELADPDPTFFISLQHLLD